MSENAHKVPAAEGSDGLRFLFLRREDPSLAAYFSFGRCDPVQMGGASPGRIDDLPEWPGWRRFRLDGWRGLPPPPVGSDRGRTRDRGSPSAVQEASASRRDPAGPEAPRPS